MNALNAEDVARLNPWCGSGQTIALLGSSGVGKSTLVNSLLGGDVQAQQPFERRTARVGTPRPIDPCIGCRRVG